MPNTLARSVMASAGMPSAAARATPSSMRTIPSLTENSLCSRRWTKAGAGMDRGDYGKIPAREFYTGVSAQGPAAVKTPEDFPVQSSVRKANLRFLTAIKGLVALIAGLAPLAQVRRGKTEGEGRVQARLASYSDPAAVELRDGLDDRKTQTRTGRGFFARAAGAIEAVEDARQMLRRDSGAGIGHFDLGRAVAPRHRLHGDRAVRVAVAQRVGEKISNRPVEHQLVRPGARFPASLGAHFEREADVALLREQLVVGKNLSQRLAQVDPLRRGARLRVVGAGEKEHVLEHPRE